MAASVLLRDELLRERAEDAGRRKLSTLSFIIWSKNANELQTVWLNEKPAVKWFMMQVKSGVICPCVKSVSVRRLGSVRLSGFVSVLVSGAGTFFVLVSSEFLGVADRQRLIVTDTALEPQSGHFHPLPCSVNVHVEFYVTCCSSTCSTLL